MLEVVLFLIALWLVVVLWPVIWRLALAVLAIVGLLWLTTGG